MISILAVLEVSWIRWSSELVFRLWVFHPWYLFVLKASLNVLLIFSVVLMLDPAFSAAVTTGVQQETAKTRYKIAVGAERHEDTSDLADILHTYVLGTLLMISYWFAFYFSAIIAVSVQLQFTFRSQLTATVRSFDSSLKLPGMEGGEGEEKGAWQEILVSPRTFRPGSVSTLLESLSSAFQIFKSSFNTAICKDPVYSCPPPPK